MMPVRYEDLTSDLELPARFDIREYMDPELFLTSELSCEASWKHINLLETNDPTFFDDRFGFETMVDDDELSLFELGQMTGAGNESKKACYSCYVGRYDREIRHHDCMWGGFCSSNDHGSKFLNGEIKSEPSTESAPKPEVIARIKQEPPQEPSESETQVAVVEPAKIKTEPVYDLVPKVKSEPCESVSVCNATDVPNTKFVSITTKPPSSNAVAEEVVPRRRYIVQRTPVSRNLLTKKTITLPLPASRVKSEITPSSRVSIVKAASPEKSWSASRPETPQSLPDSDDETTPIPFNNAGQALFKSAIDTIIGANPQSQLPSYDTWDSEDSTDALASWPVSEVTGQVRRTSVSKIIHRSVNVTDFDHNYGMKITSAKYTSPVRPDDLGVQTPSDSEEEEVDVVSFQDTSSTRSSSRSSSVSREFIPPSMADEESSCNDLEESPDRVTTYFTKSQRYVKRKRRKSFSYDDDYIEDSKSHRVSQPRKRARVSKSKTSRSSSKNSSPTKSRFGSTDSESEHTSTARRSFHNSMERKRRVDLRNSFEDLRLLVPRIEDKKRSPKVVILNEAAMFCMELSKSSQKMSAELTALRRQQEHLRSTVSMLRKSLAANR